MTRRTPLLAPFALRGLLLRDTVLKPLYVAFWRVETAVEMRRLAMGGNRTLCRDRLGTALSCASLARISRQPNSTCVAKN